MDNKKEKNTEGWWNPEPFSAKSKFHYMRNGMALCGKWAYLAGHLEEGNDSHPENCKICVKRKRLATLPEA